MSETGSVEGVLGAAKELKYVLNDPFEYANQGASPQAGFITLKAPTSKHLESVGYLKAAFYKAIDDAADDEGGGKAPEEVTGVHVMSTLAVSPLVDYAEVMKVGRDLFVHGKVALVDGEIPMNGPLMEKVSWEDLEGMLGAYLVGFPLRSTLERAKS